MVIVYEFILTDTMGTNSFCKSKFTYKTTANRTLISLKLVVSRGIAYV